MHIPPRVMEPTTIEGMVNASRERGHDYIGISDHSQTLKIAHGLSEQALWDQIQFIDKLNERLSGIRVLKSAEVDILVDGSLDYPNDVLKELDWIWKNIDLELLFMA